MRSFTGISAFEGMGRSSRNACIAIAGICCLILAMTGVAHAAPHAQASRTTVLASGAERTTYKVGPIHVDPGQNRIKYAPVPGTARPSVDGYITRIKPNLVRADGSVPKSSKIMFHHGVWINTSRMDPTSHSKGERFYATGEEKTMMQLPPGYGYPYKVSDGWLLNHMLHNLTPETMDLYIIYTIDFIPATAPEAASIKPVRPIWMDVQNGSIYPVFDVHRGEGGKDGKFTYPRDAKYDPYPVGPDNPEGIQKNEWTVDRDGILIGTTGHVHTGGLSTDLYLKRPGAKYAGPVCRKPSNSSKKALRRVRKCKSKMPSVKGDTAHLFKSTAHYFEPAGPVSWDMAMISTRPNWRVAVKAGDVLDLQTTYETKLASWYESMGINVLYMADPGTSKADDPFKTKVDGKGIINHGHYAENNDHGGKKPLVGPDPTKLPNGIASGGPFDIGDFTYAAGDFRLPGEAGRPPTVLKGQSFTFQLSSGDLTNHIYHSLTSCKSPCNKSTGIAYPIADGKFQFDSGQLGPVNDGPPTVGRTDWTTPANLSVGTHTFFCRIHPLMRGAIRVIDPKSPKKRAAFKKAEAKQAAIFNSVAELSGSGTRVAPPS